MPRTYSRPYYAQARTWQRFARSLRRASCPAFSPYHTKEHALSASLGMRAKGLVFPTTLEDTAPGGLAELADRTARGERYPEVVARVHEVDPDDPTADEVRLFLEVADRTGTQTEKRYLGRLPAKDALWVAPLIRLEADAYGTGPVLRYHVTGGIPADDGRAEGVHVAVSRAHEAAAAWLDWADDRRAWAEAHAEAEESPYAYRASYRDTLSTRAGGHGDPGETDPYGETEPDDDWGR
ncbi:hypothetical protein RQM47_16330 [Rubrivirga sp. S365]|uniref:hypothetical protein n=1 Tax=Rubrivirga sp. S365 TaxID=3076080 RepID=UPI0028CA048B|nr:hypothetical protein [Rubrivirga sp. S365]MDT7858217.1 hypothetical protein [Rubrivirga sp. S365]